MGVLDGWWLWVNEAGDVHEVVVRRVVGVGLYVGSFLCEHTVRAEHGPGSCDRLPV